MGPDIKSEPIEPPPPPPKPLTAEEASELARRRRSRNRDRRGRSALVIGPESPMDRQSGLGIPRQ